MKVNLRAYQVGFLLLGSILSFFLNSPTADGAGEVFTLTSLPSRVQELNTPGVAMVLNVSKAAVGTPYTFVWVVTDPTGASKNHNNQTVATASSFVLSLIYPRDFGTSITLVGNYSLTINEQLPQNVPGVKSGWFLVGLTDSKTYQRTFPVSIQAQGYQNNEQVTLSISHGGSSAPGYPVSSTLPTGSLSTSWAIPANVSTGAWTVSLVGRNTVKAVLDTQIFTVYPTNVTIPQLSIGFPSLQRTLLETFSLTPSYLNGSPVLSGSASLRLTETDGLTTQYVTANYNSSLGSFQGTYRISSSAEAGVWVASLDPGSFNDGYGNGGPLASVVRGFTVQLASLRVSISTFTRTFGVGDAVPIYVSITNPDGSQFTNGSVMATLSSSSTQVGTPVSLTYVSGQSTWAGSYTVKSNDPSGLWLVTVDAGDGSGNAGQQIVSLVVSVPPPPAQTPPESLNLYYFLAATLAIGGGGGMVLALRRFNIVRVPFDEFFKLAGGVIPPGSAVMLTGDPGSGTTVLGMQLLQHKLFQGGYAGLLAYDAFPSEIQRTMRGFGWDTTSSLKEGKLNILDCYSGVSGNENAPIRDPLDFTEISIQVTSMIDKAGSASLTILLDSVTPIFNSAPSKTAVNFLRVLAAKVKGAGGVLILTGAMSSVPLEAKPGLDNLLDGVVKLEASRGKDSVVRSLTVERMLGREVSSAATDFEIVQGKGILFMKPRIPLELLSHKQ